MALGQSLPNHLSDIWKKASGWVVDEIDTIWLDVASYKLFKGGSYIDLPKILKDKKFSENIQNKDDVCLPWAIVAALYPPCINVSRPSSYPLPATALNLDGIDFPTPISQITKI